MLGSSDCLMKNSGGPQNVFVMKLVVTSVSFIVVVRMFVFSSVTVSVIYLVLIGLLVSVAMIVIVSI